MCRALTPLATNGDQHGGGPGKSQLFGRLRPVAPGWVEPACEPVSPENRTGSPSIPAIFVRNARKRERSLIPTFGLQARNANARIVQVTTRFLIIAWLGWQTIMLPGGVTTASRDEAVKSCRCCATASACNCGCDATPTPVESKSSRSMKRCDCGDQPAIVIHGKHVEPKTTFVALVAASDDVVGDQVSGFMMPARLRGPPPDLVVVQSTILLV